MQDRFKFRIYCKSENKMMLFNNPTLVDGDILQGGLLFKNYDHKIKNVHEVKPEDLILMQCTGLKDKNGKLIFEGDILLSLATKSHIGVVCWDKEKAYFKINGKGIAYNALQTFCSKNAFEVIGNIYEHPELLEVDIANI